MAARARARARNPIVRRRDQCGVVILEALIALLIFSIGTLGLIGLQATMTRAQTASKFRADAANLAQQVIGQMWSDSTAGRTAYETGCASHAPCNAWASRVAALLPNGTGLIDFNGATVTVTLTWSVPNDGTSTYRTSTAIQR